MPPPAPCSPIASRHGRRGCGPAQAIKRSSSCGRLHPCLKSGESSSCAAHGGPPSSIQWLARQHYSGAAPCTSLAAPCFGCVKVAAATGFQEGRRRSIGQVCRRLGLVGWLAGWLAGRLANGACRGWAWTAGGRLSAHFCPSPSWMRAVSGYGGDSDGEQMRRSLQGATNALSLYEKKKALRHGFWQARPVPLSVWLRKLEKREPQA